LEELVQIRLKRQVVITSERPGVAPLELDVVIDESGLRRGPADVLRTQLLALLDNSELPNVNLRVFPFSAGFDEAHSTFAIFYPREEQDWPVVNVESTGKDHYYESEEEIATFEDLWRDLKERSLTVHDSRELIKSLLNQ
jgi:HSP20 family molecular chaperone IbpA